MRKLFIIFLFIFFATIASSQEIIIKLVPDVTPEDILGELVIGKRAIPQLNIFVIKLKEGVDTESVISSLRNDARVIYAEPIKSGKMQGLQIISNGAIAETIEANYENQWYLSFLEVKKAWDLSKGNGIIIALIDTGVNYNAEELLGRLLHGYDFGDNDNDPTDLNGHGTMLAHIMIAKKNGYGTVGIAPDARILPIKINPGAENTFETDKLAEAIIYAVEHGANIINLSLIVDEPSEAVKDAIDYALAHNVVVIAAAGNDGISNISFPASYEPTICVGAVDENGNRCSFSNYGEGLDFVAPAGAPGIYTIGLNDMICITKGTSLAVAMASALCANVLSIKNSNPEGIFDILKNTASHPKNWNIFTGYGAINAKRAVQMAKGYPLGKEKPHLALRLISLFNFFEKSFTFGKNQYQYLWIDTIEASPATVDIYLKITYPDNRSAFLIYRSDGLAQLIEEKKPLKSDYIFDDLEDFTPVMLILFDPDDKAMKEDLPDGTYIWEMTVMKRDSWETIEQYYEAFTLDNPFR